MKEPVRLRDPRSRASAGARALLTAAEAPAPLPVAARERVHRALARRAAMTEHGAVCWSHAFGFTLAVATCLTWLLAQRVPDTEPIARAPVTHPSAEPAAPRSAALASAHEGGPATAALAVAPVPGAVRARAPEQPVQAEAQAVQAIPARGAIARRAGAGRRWAATPARSRKRIEVLVDGILKPEAQLLDRARREAERDPEHALALIDAFRQQHPGSPLPAPIAVAEVDALRRLGRFEQAVARARALLASSRKPYYADEMAERFALLDL